MVLGPEVRSEAEPLRLLAANLGAGIIIAQEAKGTLSESDPLVIGGVGEAFLPEALTQTDLILTLRDCQWRGPLLSRYGQYHPVS